MTATAAANQGATIKADVAIIGAAAAGAPRPEAFRPRANNVNRFIRLESSQADDAAHDGVQRRSVS